MKVLLLHYANSESKNTEPLGICYLAAYLRRYDISVDLFDSRTESYNLDEYTKKVIEISNDYGLIGISTSQLFGEKKEDHDVHVIVKALKESGYKGHITCGGYGPSINYEQFAKVGVDSVSIGEGEITIHKLYLALLENRDWTDINGLAYLNNQGQVIKNPPADLPDIEANPFPARDILYGFEKKFGKKQLNPLIQASRGCYMKCAYCSTPVFLKMQNGPVYRCRSIKNVVDEIEILYKRGYKRFDFVDDNFLPPNPHDALNRARELRDELKKRNIVASFYMEFRLEYVTAELLSLLKEIGVRKLLIGVESFNKQDLELYNRVYSIEKLHKAMNMIFDAGYGMDLNSKFRFRFGFINANPLSTIESLRNNAYYLNKYNLTFKKLGTYLFLYDNNSNILKRVLEKFSEYSQDNYFKDKRVGVFFKEYKEYEKGYLYLRNMCRNIEKYINKLLDSEDASLDYKEMMTNLISIRKDLDEDTYETYMCGLDKAELDNYEESVVSFFEERKKIYDDKYNQRMNIFNEYSKLLNCKFYGQEMFFN